MSCPVCLGSDMKPAWSVGDHLLSDCSSCGHRFVVERPDETHLVRVYGDDYFFGGGAGYSNYLEEEALLRARGERYRSILAPHASRDVKLLDVGAAAGFVLAGLTGDHWRGSGVEPNERMAQHAREEFGLDVRAVPLEQFSADQPFDVVTCVQVLPHFYDLNSAMDSLSRLTRSGSLWLVETWNKDSRTARLLGKKWHEYSPPSVLHWFSPETLDRLAARYDWTRVDTGRPKKELSAAHAKSLLRHQLGGRLGKMFERSSRFVPDGWTIPYPGEDLFWALYRRG